MGNLHTPFHTLLRRKREMTGEILFQYALLMSFSISAILVLLLFTVWQALLGSFVLFATGLGCVLLLVFTLLLLRRRLYAFSACFLSAGISLFALASTLFTGPDYLFVFFLVPAFILQSTFPYHTPWVLIVSAVLFMVSAVFCLLPFSGFFAGVYTAPAGESVFYSMRLFNLCAALLLILQIVFSHRHINALIGQRMQKKAGDAQDEYIDHITQLYNVNFAKKYFEELEQTGGGETCLAIADLDDFKQLNDAYGMEMGDSILRRAADLLVTHTRKSDLIFRWKDVGFLMLINARPSDTYRLLDKIRVMVSEENFSDGRQPPIHTTMTIGMVNLDMENIAKSIDSCERKLYIGKKTGKNIVVM